MKEPLSAFERTARLYSYPWDSARGNAALGASRRAERAAGSATENPPGQATCLRHAAASADIGALLLGSCRAPSVSGDCPRSVASLNGPSDQSERLPRPIRTAPRTDPSGQLVGAARPASIVLGAVRRADGAGVPQPLLFPPGFVVHLSGPRRASAGVRVGHRRRPRTRGPTPPRPFLLSSAPVPSWPREGRRRARGRPPRGWGPASSSRGCPPGFVVHSGGPRRASASKPRGARGRIRPLTPRTSLVRSTSIRRTVVPMLRAHEQRRLSRAAVLPLGDNLCHGAERRPRRAHRSEPPRRNPPSTSPTGAARARRPGQLRQERPRLGRSRERSRGHERGSMPIAHLPSSQGKGSSVSRCFITSQWCRRARYSTPAAHRGVGPTSRHLHQPNGMGLGTSDSPRRHGKHGDFTELFEGFACGEGGQRAP